METRPTLLSYYDFQGGSRILEELQLCAVNAVHGHTNIINHAYLIVVEYKEKIANSKLNT